MTRYTSLYRRGKFNLQSDWDSDEAFMDWFESNPDIPWAILVEAKNGRLVLSLEKKI